MRMMIKLGALFFVVVATIGSNAGPNCTTSPEMDPYAHLSSRLIRESNYNPAWSSDGDVLVFSTGYGDIWKSYVKTGTVERIGKQDGIGSKRHSPSITSNGDVLYYYIYALNDEYSKFSESIRIISNDENIDYEITQIVGDDVEYASWSPDGQWIGVVSYGDQRNKLGLLKNGSDQFRRLDTLNNIDEFSWSPDSSHLGAIDHVYGGADEKDYNELVIVHIEDGATIRIRQVTLVGEEKKENLLLDTEWHPDGMSLYYVHDIENKQTERRCRTRIQTAATIMAVDRDGANHRVVWDAGSDGRVGSIEISPDSRQIAYLRWSCRYERQLLYIADIESGSEVVSDGGFEVYGASWSPDGEQIAMWVSVLQGCERCTEYYHGGGLIVMDANGFNARWLGRYNGGIGPDTVIRGVDAAEWVLLPGESMLEEVSGD